MNRAPSVIAAWLLCFAGITAWGADPSRRFVYPDADGKLVYDRDDRGNRIPDFSHCGYMGGGAALPDVPVRVIVAPADEDNGARIQAAIDYVSQLNAGEDGLRGAVLLLSGRHRISGQLHITTSGVVLRGQGAGPKGTVLAAAGKDRRALIRISGKPDRQMKSEQRCRVADSYVPVGASQLRVEHADRLQVGDTVQVQHPSTQLWISALGMNRFPSRDVGSWLDWRPGTLDVQWDRTVAGIQGSTVTLDAPLTMALDASLGVSEVAGYSWPGRIQQVGIENLRCESDFDPANPKDEEHSWTAISLEAAQDGWVRQVTAARFVHSAVCIRESCSRITVEDCEAFEPVSEAAAYRRHTFYTAGQQTLFQRSRSAQGRHDFGVGYLAAGPNAFVHCQASEASHYSGPIESWASGVLYDNVTMDGGGLALTNRETDGQGVGWAAANCVLWQCVAPIVTCRQPPTAQNWAIGCWGQFVGDGHWRSLNEFIDPDSLYYAQLKERLGQRAVDATKPRQIPTEPLNAPAIEHVAQRQPAASDESRPSKPILLRSGWLIRDDKLLIGDRGGTVWWRGHVLPSRAGELGVGITRFVPGRDGPGYTDDLDALTSTMLAKGQTALEHHWGLWYDRRRDDHQMIRRIDGEVWPPFYEQPWARSGQGTAWDGLSKYDLSRFNPWYFGRLRQFADLCDHHGLLLVQQIYFQHNVLEAGAHWADSPWRPANCLQPTGFPEPPPYQNNKRVFMADAFYDVSHPVRRAMHQAYMRQCLDTLGGNRNVLFLTGEEFTGPLAFVQFWLDTVHQWQEETGQRVLIGLSCTKDVQDQVLADPQRGPRVSLIDMKYWWYTADGGLYDPPGGQSLAPRQQLREWQGSKSRSEAQLGRQIREYRQRYPDKAILSSLTPANAWLCVSAGASLANLPATTDPRLLSALARMQPLESDTLGHGQWALSDPGRDCFVFADSSEAIRLDATVVPDPIIANWIDSPTGRPLQPATPVRQGAVREFRPQGAGKALLWITRA